ncbi:hypothetical protein C4K39_2131 [Pseudomonas sessilinigenes]|nr:hypothetical protein C4K39_2131 [Pseudomonas sessilinigenes]
MILDIDRSKAVSLWPVVPRGDASGDLKRFPTALRSVCSDF